MSPKTSNFVKRLGRPNLHWKKHPVTLLYDYGKFYGIRPKFTFTEIHQYTGIEYACIAEMEEFFGEGKAFNKRTSKALAATNLLQKIMYNTQTSLFQKKKPTRYVSQTFVVSVVPDSNGPEPRNNSSDSKIISSGESVTGQILLPVDFRVSERNNSKTLSSKFDRESPSSEASDMGEEITDTDPEEPEETTEDSRAKESVLEEINSFCCIKDQPHFQQMTKIQGKVDKKLKFLDPRQYLEKCCLEQGLKPPAYVALIKDGQFVAHCSLLNKLTNGKGDQMPDAKQLAATRMIELLDW